MFSWKCDKKFEEGSVYRGRYLGKLSDHDDIKITRRTDKSIWYVRVFENGSVSRMPEQRKLVEFSMKQSGEIDEGFSIIGDTTYNAADFI